MDCNSPQSSFDRTGERLANDGLMQSVERVANDAIDTIGGESSQRCHRHDQWRVWPTTRSVERVANDAINAISGESSQ